LFVITDAVTETDQGYYPHQLAGDKYESGGILSGSALNMAKAVKNLVDHCGLDLAEALRMASLYPAKVMGPDNDNGGKGLGRIKKGYQAAIVAMNEQLEVMDLFS
jgi:N-acetylglucosamine-6-phosphate deacetylase